jgi:hypothetical protein
MFVGMEDLGGQWQRLRPRARRISSALSGPTFTLVCVIAGLWLTWVPLVIISGPKTDAVLRAVTTFSQQFEQQAPMVQNALIAVLAAIFIARVVNRRAEESLRDAAGVWAVVFVHVLAAVIVDAAILGCIGATAAADRGGHLWTLLVLAGVGLTLAWSVDAGFSGSRAEQRRRTENELEATSWAVHRRAALLYHQRKVRIRPRSRVWLLAVTTWIVTALAGSLIFAIAWGGQWLEAGVVVLLLFGPLAGWSALWAVTLAAMVAFPGQTRGLLIASWSAAAFLVAVPTLTFTLLSHPQHIGVFRFAVVVSGVLPFLHLIGPVRRRWTLRAASLAVELRRYRRRRRVLLQDLYILREKPAAAASAPTLRWPRRWTSSRRRAAREATAPIVSLQAQRPPEGPGALQWWNDAGQPPMYRR